MKTKMISIHLETWKELLHIKAENELRTFDEVVRHLLNKPKSQPVDKKEPSEELLEKNGISKEEIEENKKFWKGEKH